MLYYAQQVEELLNIVHQKTFPYGYGNSYSGQKFGREVEQGRLIDLVITHDEIAEVINSTRVSVTRALGV